MAACKSLRHIFDTTVPENKSPSLIESLSSLNHIRSYKSALDHHSFTEIFGELHFKENHNNSTSSSIFPPFPSPSATISSAFPIEPVSQSRNNDNQQEEKIGGKVTLFSTNSDGYSLPYHKKSASFTSLNSDSLQFCTEGLGSESLDDTEDLKIEVGNGIGEKVHVRRQSCDSYLKKKKTDGKTVFPPPIPYIGKTGKPSVSFQSFRNEGRFVLKEVRVPTQECLRAKREDGRLRLSFVQPDDEDEDEDDDDDVEVEGDGGAAEEEEESDDDNDGSVVEKDDGGKERETGGVRKMEEEERGDGDKEEYGDKDDFEISSCKE